MITSRDLPGSLDYLFAKDFLKTLKEKQDQITEHITIQVLSPDEYAKQVGYLQAIKEMKSEFEILARAYFNN